MKKTILVTGASGFIGQYLCRELLATGYDVIGCGRQPTQAIEDTKFQYYSFDLQKAGSHAALFKGVDAVVHMAALAHQLDQPNPAAYYNINTEYTKKLASICAQAGVKHFIYISSIKAVGERTTQAAFDESTRPAPLDPYGRSKWFAEQFIQDIAQETQMAWTIIRPPLVYGPSVKANFASLIKMIDSNLPLPLGKINNNRSLIAIDNLCDFILKCLSHPCAQNQVFNVSDDDDQSTKSLVLALKDARQSRTKILGVPLTLLKLACLLLGKSGAYHRLNDSLTIDVTKAKMTLGWKPKLRFCEATQKYFTKL